MMMKMKTIALTVAIFMCGCSQQELSVEKGVVEESNLFLIEKSQAVTFDSVQYYFDQARLGIGDAYVKMAEYNLDGALGKPNLLNIMSMGSMAEEYMAIPNPNALFKDVPDENVTKMACQALDMLNHIENEDSILVKSKELLDMGISEGFLLQAVLLWKKGNRDDAITLCNKSVQGGSTIADVFKDIIVAGEEYGGEFNPQTLLKIADRFPMAYRLLGDYYAKIPTDSALDIPLARQYYLKASDHACLGRREALWVLETIYIKGYPAVDSLIDKRLWSLGRNEINDSVIWLP